jgi:hypothetical protein
MVIYDVTANYPNLVTKRQFQTHFGHTLVTILRWCDQVMGGGVASRPALLS